MRASDFVITSGTGSPIFRQVVDRVRLGVATGRLAAGEPLPSVRALAERLLVNPNTIAKAYAELAREGVIETRPGRGAVVAAARQVYTRAERLRRLDPLLDALAAESVALGFTRADVVDALEARLDELGPAAPTGRKP